MIDDTLHSTNTHAYKSGCFPRLLTVATESVGCYLLSKPFLSKSGYQSFLSVRPAIVDTAVDRMASKIVSKRVTNRQI